MSITPEGVAYPYYRVREAPPFIQRIASFEPAFDRLAAVARKFDIHQGGKGIPRNSHVRPPAVELSATDMLRQALSDSRVIDFPASSGRSLDHPDATPELLMRCGPLAEGLGSVR